MSKPLPPLPLLQTIEAVTRLGSLKRAAEELLVTPSAISHRVRLVEELFGERLFEREGQGIRPTENARRLAASVAGAVAGIDAEWRELTNATDARQVRLCCMAAFAEEFIISNLTDFRQRFPDFQLESTSLSFFEGGMRGGYDILVGIGPYPDESWDYQDLLPLTLRPIYSNASGTRLVEGDTLLGPLLDASNTYLPWHDAAAELGLKIADDARTMRFDSLLAAGSAAARGQGIALAPSWVARRLAERPDIIVLGDRPIPTTLTYWIAARKARKLDTTFGRFHRWLQAIIKAEI